MVTGKLLSNLINILVTESDELLTSLGRMARVLERRLDRLEKLSRNMQISVSSSLLD